MTLRKGKAIKAVFCACKRRDILVKSDAKDLAIRDKFESCRRFFDSDKSRSYQTRRQQLLLLQGRIKELTPEIEQALKDDLNNSSFEAYMTEIGLVLDEIGYALKHLKRWMKPRAAKVALTQMPGRVKRFPEPYGVVLIMSPWNYPFQLSVNPLVGAIAAGNTAILKPSAYSPATTEVLGKVLTVLEPGWVELVTGGREENRDLLKLDFDYIFFTGSPAVGRDVMRQAAENLTPVTLELGGKSPAIVAADADLKLAARRIAFGKLVNAGQTCIAPDYVICEEAIKEAFLKLLQEEFSQLSRDDEYFREIYPKIINEKHFNRLQAYLAETPPAFGGRVFPETRQIEPAIIDSPAEDSEVMQEEIFGPILPVISLPDLGTAISYVRQRPKPLALYIFSEKKETQDLLLDTISFGGGCINDTLVHMSSPHVPFGGVGNSGMGQYHGKFSFDSFSHYKTVLKKSRYGDLSLRYHPYREIDNKIIRKMLK